MRKDELVEGTRPVGGKQAAPFALHARRRLLSCLVRHEGRLEEKESARGDGSRQQEVFPSGRRLTQLEQPGRRAGRGGAASEGLHERYVDAYLFN